MESNRQDVSLHFFIETLLLENTVWGASCLLLSVLFAPPSLLCNVFYTCNTIYPHKLDRQIQLEHVQIEYMYIIYVIFCGKVIFDSHNS